MSVSVAIVGAGGRMGRFTVQLLEAEEDFGPICSVGRRDDLAAKLRAARPDVGVDFTAAGLGARHARVMLECGVRPLVGTSGVDEAADLELDRLARSLGLGGLIVPNFSLGVWLQQRLACELVRFFPEVEILEEHHAAKRDAPSGTALDTAARLAATGRTAPRRPVPIHSLRLPGLYSNQTLVFGGPGEVLRIVHETYGLEAFAPGILAGLRYVQRALGVTRGIGPAFELAAQLASAP